ncbi:MAG: hypothetical protein ABW202_15585 [Duganella sp.]
MSDFYRYFKENMEALGLPAPESLFGTLQTTVATVTVLLTNIDKYGKTVTVGELLGAGTRLEKLSVAAALSAAFYAGACIGSLAVATGRTLAGGTSLADVLLAAHTHRLNRTWLTPILLRSPAIYRPCAPSGKSCKYIASKR